MCSLLGLPLVVGSVLQACAHLGRGVDCAAFRPNHQEMAVPSLLVHFSGHRAPQASQVGPMCIGGGRRQRYGLHGAGLARAGTGQSLVEDWGGSFRLQCYRALTTSEVAPPQTLPHWLALRRALCFPCALRRLPLWSLLLSMPGTLGLGLYLLSLFSISPSVSVAPRSALALRAAFLSVAAAGWCEQSNSEVEPCEVFGCLVLLCARARMRTCRSDAIASLFGAYSTSCVRS